MNATIDKDNSLYYVTVNDELIIFADTFEFVLEELLPLHRIAQIQNGWYGEYYVEEYRVEKFMERVKQYEVN